MLVHKRNITTKGNWNWNAVLQRFKKFFGIDEIAGNARDVRIYIGNFIFIVQRPNF